MPNKKKKGFKRNSLSSTRPKLKHPKRVRKQWTEEQMSAALHSVAQGLSGNKAADVHGVPRSTLKDRLSGRVAHGTKSGPKPYLSPIEEAELTNHLLSASKMGFGKTRRDVKLLVETYTRSKGTLKGSEISNGWWQKFLKRNPSLRLRAGDATAGVRMDAVNVENITAYFDLLRNVFDEFGFDQHPERIYNMDETGVPLEPHPPKVVAFKGQKKVRYRTSGQKAQITVIGCGSATGQALPPFIIFSAKQLNILWTKGEVSGSRYGVSDKGWVDQELFYYWLKEHFLENAVSQRPLLLLLDGHSSHFEPCSIQFAKDNEVIIFCLPPHTTHECQPLDCSLFGPLKHHWREECHKFYQSNPGRIISKLNFCSVFRNAWLNAVTPANICGGFKKAGVFPFNRDAVLVSCSGAARDGDNYDGRHTILPTHTSTYSSQTHIVAWPPYTHFHTQIHSHTHTFSAIQFQMSRTVRVTVTTALLTVVEMTVMVSTVFHSCIQVLTCSYIHTVITFIHTFLPQIHTHKTHTHTLLCFSPRLWG